MLSLASQLHTLIFVDGNCDEFSSPKLANSRATKTGLALEVLEAAVICVVFFLVFLILSRSFQGELTFLTFWQKGNSSFKRCFWEGIIFGSFPGWYIFHSASPSGKLDPVNKKKQQTQVSQFVTFWSPIVGSVTFWPSQKGHELNHQQEVEAFSDHNICIYRYIYQKNTNFANFQLTTLPINNKQKISKLPWRLSGAWNSEQFLPRQCGLHLVWLRRHLRRAALRWGRAGPRGGYLRTEGESGDAVLVSEHLMPYKPWNYGWNN